MGQATRMLGVEQQMCRIRLVSKPTALVCNAAKIKFWPLALLYLVRQIYAYQNICANIHVQVYIDLLAFANPDHKNTQCLLNNTCAN